MPRRRRPRPRPAPRLAGRRRRARARPAVPRSDDRARSVGQLRGLPPAVAWRRPARLPAGALAEHQAAGALERRPEPARASAGSARGSQPGWARRTSSWWTKNSTRLTTARPPRPGRRPRRWPVCGRARPARASLPAACRPAPAGPAAPGAGTSSPTAASGRPSRITRCAARSRVPHRRTGVGASGPTVQQELGQCSRAPARGEVMASLQGGLRRDPGTERAHLDS